MTEKQDFFTLIGGRVKIKRGRYNPTSDAVWLAAFPDKSPKTVLDVGIGTGGVALCLAARMPNINITGIDISKEMLDECAINLELNDKSADLINADILTWRTDKTFDLVISNPPYFKGTPAKHDAHHNTDLFKWTSRCVARVKPNGTFATIVDSGAVADVIAAINNNCGDIKIMPLFSTQNTAERVLVSGTVGSHAGTRIFKGINMNTEAILRDGLTITEYLAMLSEL
ncbi:MAG: methyltransferase [Alphaproteobacteria bacterium]|nr:methyltransferase [Alphaproteobacteria bacterium]